MYTPTLIQLEPSETATLESWVRSSTTEQRLVLRARIVLLASDGLGTNAIGERLDIRPATVSKWRTRFAHQRLAGLTDAPRPGKRRRYDAGAEQRILALLDDPPPAGYAQWNGRLAAQAAGVSADFAWAVLRRHGIQLQRRRSWCISTDPAFAAKAADIVGLYLNPPDNALVVAVDEKPHIQALERAQGYLRLPNGRSVLGFGHEYKRHGTTTLLAALTVATGEVQIGHYQRHRRVEFLDFLNRVVAVHPGREIHVILDNFRTHKPKRDLWRARHKNVHFHYTPTHASWLNQVEVWFSILTAASLRNGSFTSPQQLRDAIDQFVVVYNQTAHPFEWTKEVVHPKTLKKRYSDLCK